MVHGGSNRVKCGAASGAIWYRGGLSQALHDRAFDAPRHRTHRDSDGGRRSACVVDSQSNPTVANQAAVRSIPRWVLRASTTSRGPARRLPLPLWQKICHFLPVSSAHRATETFEILNGLLEVERTWSLPRFCSELRRHGWTSLPSSRACHRTRPISRQVFAISSGVSAENRRRRPTALPTRCELFRRSSSSCAHEPQTNLGDPTNRRAPSHR